MKFRKDWMNKKWGAMTAAICIGVVLFVVLWNLPDVLHAIGRFLRVFRPIFIGIAFAYIANPLVRFFENRLFRKMRREKLKHVIAVVCTFVFVVLLLVLLGFFIIPQLITSVSAFIGNLGDYTNSLQKLIRQLSEFLAQKHIETGQFEEISEKILTAIRNFLPSSVQEILSLLGSIGTNLVDIVLAIIMAVYFLMDKERILNACKRVLRVVQKPDTYTKTTVFLSRGHTILIRYILYSLLDALLVGSVNFVFMLIAGLPYAAMVSVVVGVTNLAPTFGPIIGAVIGAFVLVLVNPLFALYFLIFTVILQIFDGYILKPRMFSGALGVPGVVVLIFIIIGSRLFGILGILLAIPCAAIVSFLVTEALDRREAKASAALAADASPVPESTESGN